MSETTYKLSGTYLTPLEAADRRGRSRTPENTGENESCRYERANAGRGNLTPEYLLVEPISPLVPRRL